MAETRHMEKQLPRTQEPAAAISPAALYRRIKPEIDSRLAEFRALWEKGSDTELWREMCFCACTPQNDAKRAHAAVLALEKEGLLTNGTAAERAKLLRANGVRFHNNKAAYITRNRQRFYPATRKRIEEVLDAAKDIAAARAAFARLLYGWGLKEASHFLRNIGFGARLCILDRHILRCLYAHNAIGTIPKTLSAAVYAETEKAMAHYAKQARIPLDALDLVFWYTAKNELFK